MKVIISCLMASLMGFSVFAGQTSRYIFKAYPLFSIDQKYIAGCASPSASNCNIPIDTILENCTFLEGRFPFVDKENLGELWCDLKDGDSVKEIRNIQLDFSNPHIEISNLRFKFQTFINWEAIRAHSEDLVPNEISIQSDTILLNSAQVIHLKNIVFGDRISNGITLNAYWTDTQIYHKFQKVLKEHCGIRADHFKGILDLVPTSQKPMILPYIKGLANSCEMN